jgi:dihydroorotate dehydrogenase electron transfer subunit
VRGAGEITSLEARVVSNRDLGRGYGLVRLEAEAIARWALPGQFVTVGFPARTDPLLPRPFAVFDAEPGDGAVDILFKVVGRGTKLLDAVEPGERLRLVGPLGRPWRPVEAETSLLLAGGTGWGALHYLAKALVGRGPEAGEVAVVWGQCSGEAFPAEPLEVEGTRAVYATEDGTCGFCGTSVECLRGLVEGELAGRRAAVYAAGPVEMLAAAAGVAREIGLPCQVSLEARMACGIGACRGCVVNATSPDPETGLRRRTVCRDGPVFDADDLDWEDLW